MNQLFKESAAGVLAVLIAGLISEGLLTSPELKFAVPLAVGILWSAGLLYRSREA